MLDQGFYVDATPPQTGGQREVRPAVEGQGPPAPTSAPPHEIAGFLMQPAMLGGGNLAGRALDQRGQLFAGEPTDLDAHRPASALNSDQAQRPPAVASKSPSRQRGALWWMSAPDSAAIMPP